MTTGRPGRPPANPFWSAPAGASAPKRSCPPRGCSMASPFVHLHVHSQYSLMRGTERLEALADAARERGMDRFALTDTNALYGFVFYRQICDEAGLTPIAGAEIVEAGAPAAKAGGEGRAVLLARGRDGYRSLCRVITARHLEPAVSLPAAIRAN